MSTRQIIKPKIEISPKILQEIESQVHEMGQVILHILFDAQKQSGDMLIRIWPTSYLYDLHSSHISDLVHCENIVLAPHWQQVMPGSKCYFTLIFSGLPRDCTVFDFIEHCGSESGGFDILNIARTESDIYYFTME